MNALENKLDSKMESKSGSKFNYNTSHRNQNNTIFGRPQTNVERLRERVNYCYEQYTAETLKLSKQEIFERAEHIVAISEMHILMTYSREDFYWVGEDEAAYLLRFANPLQVLVNAWRNYTITNGVDYDEFLSEFMRSSEKERDEEVATVNKLLEKYGFNADIFSAALVELVELGMFLNGDRASGSSSENLTNNANISNSNNHDSNNSNINNNREGSF